MEENRNIVVADEKQLSLEQSFQADGRHFVLEDLANGMPCLGLLLAEHDDHVWQIKMSSRLHRKINAVCSV